MRDVALSAKIETHVLFLFFAARVEEGLCFCVVGVVLTLIG